MPSLKTAACWLAKKENDGNELIVKTFEEDAAVAVVTRSGRVIIPDLYPNMRNTEHINDIEDRIKEDDENFIEKLDNVMTALEIVSYTAMHCGGYDSKFRRNEAGNLIIGGIGESVLTIFALEDGKIIGKTYIDETIEETNGNWIESVGTDLLGMFKHEFDDATERYKYQLEVNGWTNFYVDHEGPSHMLARDKDGNLWRLNNGKFDTCSYENMFFAMACGVPSEEQKLPKVIFNKDESKAIFIANGLHVETATGKTKFIGTVCVNDDPETLFN